MTVNQAIADATVLQRLRLLELEGEAVRRVTDIYLGQTQPIFDELATIHKTAADAERTFTVAERERIRELRAALDEATRTVHAEMRRVMFASMRAGAQRGAGVAGVLQSTLPAQLAEDVTHIALADAAQAIFMPVGGLRWTDRLARDLVESNSRLQAILGQAAKTGASMDKVAKLIEQSTTIRETYRGRFVAIARTEVQRVSNAAAVRTYQANSDIIAGYQWLATLDSRTCVICASLHEEFWPAAPDGSLSTGTKVPPAHPRCRCFLVPVTKTWKELGLGGDEDERRELDGRAAARMDFDSWLQRQDPDVQRNTLGSEEKRQEWLEGRTLASIAAPGVARIPPPP